MPKTTAPGEKPVYEKPPTVESGEVVFGERLRELMDFEVTAPPLGQSETKELAIQVNFKAAGSYKLKSINWTFMNRVNFKFDLSTVSAASQILPTSVFDNIFPPTYYSERIRNFSTLNVQPGNGILDIRVLGHKPELFFGEVHKSLICLRNIGDSSIDECYLISLEPLITGFGFKAMKPLGKGETIDSELYIRGMGVQSSMTVSLFCLYKTKDTWRMSQTFFSTAINPSFATKYFSEDLEDGTRLIGIDVVPKRRGEYNQPIAPNSLDACLLKIISNEWALIPNSHNIVQNDQAFLIYCKVKKRQEVDYNIVCLARKHREVGCALASTSMTGTTRSRSARTRPNTSTNS